MKKVWFGHCIAAALTTSLFLATMATMSYPGGKISARHKLINLMPPHDGYFEPFSGGCALMLAKRPARLNVGVELNREVWEWQCRDLVASLETAARACGGENGDAAGGIVSGGRSSGAVARNGGAAGSLKITTAAEVIRFGDAGNGGAVLALRTGDNRSHVGNRSHVAESDAGRRVSPFAATADPDAANGDGDVFRFLQGDGIDFLKSYAFTRSDLVYCDPPYMLKTRSGGRLYAHEMTDRQHLVLLRTIKRLPCMVIISGYWSELYARELKGWNSTRYKATTRGGVTTEWAWYNYPRPLALHDDRFLGANNKEREQLKRKKQRWTGALRRMPELERQVLLCSLTSDRKGRERTKRKRERWQARINRMPLLERQALLSAIGSVAGNGAGGPSLEMPALASGTR